MTIIRIRTKTNTKLVKKGLQDFAAEPPKVGRQQIYQALVRARSKLKKPGKRVTYPVPWDNIRQKIKVIMMLRKANNLPYRRKGDYQKAFKLVKRDDGYSLENTADKAAYIGGDAEGKGQSRIFRRRYPIIRKVVDQEMAKLPSAVVKHLELVARQKGLK